MRDLVGCGVNGRHSARIRLGKCYSLFLWINKFDWAGPGERETSQSLSRRVSNRAIRTAASQCGVLQSEKRALLLALGVSDLQNYAIRKMIKNPDVVRSGLERVARD